MGENSSAGKNKKKKKRINLAYILFLIIGGICGGIAGGYLAAMPQKPLFDQLGSLFLFAIVLIAVVYLQVIIHEAGHLVFGLLTGYKFSSFRIGSFMLVKEQGKSKIKRMSLAGTGGQCLMSLPELIGGKIPFVLYNLGGALFNFVAGALSFLLYPLFKSTQYISLLFMLNGIIGIAYALMNGIPMHIGPVDNDGFNTLSLSKNGEALRAFWVQLSVASENAKGARLKDLPDDWFYMPSDEGMKNSMVAVTGVFTCNRLMDLHEFDDAYEKMNNILEVDTAIVGLHRGLLNCDCIYLELIGENRKDHAEALRDKQQIKFMKAMKNFPTILRTEYAYSLLAKKDDAKAEKIKAIFEKQSITYPHKGDIESERELMQIAKDKYEKQKTAALLCAAGNSITSILLK